MPAFKFLTQQQQLARHILFWTENKLQYDIPELDIKLFRRDSPTEPVSSMQAASLCVIAQGKKQVILENEKYIYDSKHFLITAIDLPIVGTVIEASPEQPYLGLMLGLDLSVITQILIDFPQLERQYNHLNQQHLENKNTSKMGIAIGQNNGQLTEALCRLLNLINPTNNNIQQDLVFLAPLIKKEIYYYLLCSEQGQRLRQFVSREAHGYRILRSIQWLRENFPQQFKIEDLAKSIGMSVSSFHQHFREATSMSPLQYQKKLRLNEARKLIMTENLDISVAAMQVGYESSSQFSREYHRYFGIAPSFDLKQHKL
ncbi:AraC family transcriptional regulator [Acinetobacter populi]|uniref:HTH araC/xylS-type domain-containing protein n=1 Tax=Acinetobacter populi TaxID=1582270 RepID=A0A1Z9YTM1_9GAMM|nr:AraC family transcriptional regulator [Acinetobacter populi]OUY05548.1 hypothetical protein CAP51_16520 [Acinetobacter populi]